VIAALLAALSALVYGTGDFLGGTASRRAPVVTATLVAKAFGLPIVVLAALVLPAPDGITLAGLGWGVAAEVAGVGGIVLFYRAMAAGRMTVVAPTTAAACAAVPVCIGIAVDGSPGPWRLLGLAVAVIGVALVSAAPDEPQSERVLQPTAVAASAGNPVGPVQAASKGAAPALTHHAHGMSTPKLILLSVVGGAGFGLFFALLDRAGSGSGQWPLVSAQLAAVVALAAVVGVRRMSFRLPRSVMPYALGAGVFEIVANVLYVLANNLGQLAIVAAIASLYPASTVVLAMRVNRERIRGWQVLGLAMAGVALVVLAVTP
jgi:drug/metabolite transporter (DMT)-like permease